MLARFASSCLCGEWVKPGMRIAFCPDIRRVTMCPKCSPRANSPKGTVGPRYHVKIQGTGPMTVASVRINGKVEALSFRWAAGDSSEGYCHYRNIGGQWTMTKTNYRDCPDHLTHNDVNEAVRMVRESMKAAA